MMQTYTDQQVAAALARLELNRGNLKRTAREIGVPPNTLRRWADKLAIGAEVVASAACYEDEGSAAVATLATPTATPKTESAALAMADLWEGVQRLAIQRATDLLPTASLRDVSILAGIAADKHMDYSQGRKGAGVSVSADKMIVVIE